MHLSTLETLLETPEVLWKLAGDFSHRITGKKIMRAGRGAGTVCSSAFRRPLRGGSEFEFFPGVPLVPRFTPG